MRYKPALLMASFAALLYPVSVFAQSALSKPIIPASCNGIGGCKSVCDIAIVAQNILNVSIYVAVFLSAVLFAYGGFKYLTAGGGEGISEGKRILTNVFIGLIIILAGWLVVDTLMKTLTDAKFGPWNKICQEVKSLFDHRYA